VTPVIELVAAAVFVVGGVRSLWRWGRRGFEGTRATDHMFYALWLTGRAGVWFSVAGIFAISAALGTRGRAFEDEFERFRWYILVPIGLAALQLLAGLALGRRSSG